MTEQNTGLLLGPPNAKTNTHPGTHSYTHTLTELTNASKTRFCFILCFDVWLS